MLDTLIDTGEPPTDAPANYVECPAHLREPGRARWQWLRGLCEQTGGAEQLVGVFPMAVEFCENCDLLADLRTALKTQGLMVSGGRGASRRNPLLAEIARVQKNQIQLWRSMGLADRQPEDKNPIGRPPGSGKGCLW